MKKILGLILGIVSVTNFANAQYVTDGSYMVYQEPYVARSYGQPNWSYVSTPRSYPQPVYTNGYVQRYPQNGYQKNPVSPVYKRFYLSLHAGIGGTFGWDENKTTGEVNNPIGAVLGLSIGAYLKPNVRLEGEFAYHTKDDLYSGKDVYITGKGEYSQYDFGANLYYDFNTHSDIRPFIGLGVWGISSKISSDIQNTYGDTRDTSRSVTNFAVSGALGISYQVNSTVTLEAMTRARYIFSEDIYNLEGLVSSRFSF